MILNMIPFEDEMKRLDRFALAFSGGLDSTVLLWMLLSSFKTVKPVLVNYGQRHQVELTHAQNILNVADNKFKGQLLDAALVNLEFSSPLVGSSQTDLSVAVPEGHYTDQTMRATIVPNRNAILLSICAAYAFAENLDAVAYAAHEGDHVIYPDCRPAFSAAFDTLLKLADFKTADLHAPFLGLSKAQVVSIGQHYGAPMHLSYSCYKGKFSQQCGKCGTCVERREAFAIAKVADLTTYESA